MVVLRAGRMVFRKDETRVALMAGLWADEMAAGWVDSLVDEKVVRRVVPLDLLD